MKRVKSVTLDRKLSSTARLPQRSTVVESPAGRIADGNGHVVSARSEAALSADIDDVDIIRPAFARNNTSVLIVNDTPDAVLEGLANTFVLPSLNADEDAITLGDLTNLAQHKRPDDKPLLSTLNQLQSLIVKHFALLQLQKSQIANMVELDEVLELLDVRKSQWWNKIFKGTNKKDQKKKGQCFVHELDLYSHQGVFGVPLEVLIERTGSDSHQGMPNSTLRVPEFVEDITATMRQMGTYGARMCVRGLMRRSRCGGDIPEEW